MFRSTLTGVFSGLVALGTIGLGVTVPVHAQDVDEPTVILYSGGIDAMFPSQKDRGLVRALHMIDQRLGELPREFDADEVPGPVIETMVDLLLQPMTLRAGVVPGVDPQDEPPFWGQINFFREDQKSAAALAARFAGWMGMGGAGVGEPRDMLGTTLNVIDADGVDLMHGAMTLGDRPSTVVALRTAHDVAPPLQDWTPMIGTTPALAGRIDLGTIKPLLDQVMAEADEDERAMMRLQLQTYGLMSDHPPVIEFAHGFAGGKALTRMRMHDCAGMLAQSGIDRDRPLTKGDLAVVPRDATWAQISRFNLEMYIDSMIEMMRQSPEIDANMGDGDPMDMVAQQIGIHPRHELLAHLGDLVGVYSGDSTGGGYLGMVVFASVNDADALHQTMHKMAAMANAIAQQEARGYVNMASRTIDDHDVMVLTFPGLPIPLELSIGLANGYLFAAASPGALRAAMAQSTPGNGSNLNANASFRRAGGDDMTGAIKVTYVDTPRLAGQGYGVMSLAASALANFVRSPRGQREAGYIMPSYAEMMKDVKPAVSFTRIDGDDLVVMYEADESAIVNISAMAGSMGGGLAPIAAVGIMVGLLMPALDKARTNAQLLKSQTQLKQVAMAFHVYAAAHDDQFPDNLDVLIDEHYITRSLLDSPIGDMWDGDDYWIDTSGRKSDFSPRRIIGYDRYVYMMGEHPTPVVFADGHSEQLWGWELEQRMQEDIHDGIDFDLP